MAIVAKAKQINTERKGRFYEVPDGGKYPSVTTILNIIAKPALINWAANMERTLVVEASADLYEDLPVNGGIPKMERPTYITSLQNRLGKTKAHQKALTKAGEIGSQVHALIEWNTRKSLGEKVGPEPHLIDRATWAFSVWEKWAKKSNFKPIHCEQTVWSNEHRYAGTMDLMAEVKVGGTDEIVRVVVDWKTGKAIYPEALLQNVAYIKALIEMGHAKPPLHGLIVRLPKNEEDPEPEVRLIPWAEQDSLFRAFIHARALWGWQFEQQNGQNK